MYRKILVPLDGSAFAEFALPSAMTLARALPAGLDLVTVQNPVPTFAFGEWDIDPEEWRQDYLQDVARRVASASGIEPGTRIRVGAVDRELVDDVEESDVDLVVLATHGRGPVSRFWLGSVADAMVRHSPRPVLLVRPEDDREPDLADRELFDDILVTLDGSKEAEAILDHVVALAEIADAKLRLLRVVHFPAELVSAYPPHTFEMNEEMVEAGERRARRYLEGVAEELSGRGAKVEIGIRVDSHPAQGIVHEVEETAPDLLAMTTHGRGGISRTVLGSVTDKVIRAVHTPLFVVRPDTEEA